MAVSIFFDNNPNPNIQYQRTIRNLPVDRIDSEARYIYSHHTVWTLVRVKEFTHMSKSKIRVIGKSSGVFTGNDLVGETTMAEIHHWNLDSVWIGEAYRMLSPGVDTTSRSPTSSWR